MCDGCNADVFITRAKDGKLFPLHEGTKSKRLFIFESVPTFNVVYLHLERMGP